MFGSPREKRSVPRAHGWLSALTAAPVAVTALLAALLLLPVYSDRFGWSSVSTGVGDYQRLPLSDGSTLELNTASEVRYRLSETSREIHLTAGEARFRVARDVQRPFVVLAANTMVRAVGTEFTVRIRHSDTVDVLVEKGVVSVSRRVRENAVREFLRGRVIPAGGGTRVPEKSMVTDDGARLVMVEMSRVNMEAHDAWRNNMLIFNETPLREIVEEFNRYNRRQLKIADARLANVPIGGRYPLRDVEGFLRNLRDVMKFRVEEERGALGDQPALLIYSAAADDRPYVSK